jgi:DNA-binding NtrC family response regulator
METQTTPTLPSEEPEIQREVSLDFKLESLPTMQEVERQYLNLVLKQTGGNKVQAAKILGVSVKTIYNKLDSYREAICNRP